MPSSTPLHLSWCSTRCASITPALFSSLGMMHRTKLGVVLPSVQRVIREGMKWLIVHHSSLIGQLRESTNMVSSHIHVVGALGDICTTELFFQYQHSLQVLQIKSTHEELSEDDGGTACGFVQQSQTVTPSFLGHALPPVSSQPTSQR